MPTAPLPAFMLGLPFAPALACGLLLTAAAGRVAFADAISPDSAAEPGASQPLAASPAAIEVAGEAGTPVTTQVRARLRPGTQLVIEPDGRPSFRAPDGAVVPGLDDQLVAAGVLGVAPTLSVVPARPMLAASLGLDRWMTIRVPAGSDTPMLATLLRRFETVFELVEHDVWGGVSAGAPSDPNFGLQYSLQNTGQMVSGQAGVPGADIGAPAAWEVTTGDGSVVIAVLDSGVNAHVDLGGRILPGWNVPQQNTQTGDVCSSHGTHVSGIATATGDNGVGIAGVCWSASILPIVVVNPCTGMEAWVADGLIWAADQGADIANMSLQYVAGTAYFKSAVEYAAAAGVLMIAATGNSNSNVAFPARWPETIAVAATTNQDKRWSSSNFGPEVDVAAPGWQVYSLIGTSGYGYKSGTSMSAPHVTGIAALLRAVDGFLDAEQMRAIIESTADDVEGPGFDVLTGHGRVNAASAVTKAAIPRLPGDLNLDGVVDAADLGLLLGGWGLCADCELVPCPADLDGSCEVDGVDLGLLLAAWSG